MTTPYDDIVNLDFSENEIKAIERVASYGARDDADMREAIHIMIRELAKLKNIDISDIDIDDGSWADI